MPDNGTAQQADDRISSHEISQEVRGSSDLLARVWRLASTSTGSGHLHEVVLAISDRRPNWVPLSSG